jgi:hypothetical protein
MSKSVFSISLLAATAFMLPAFGADGTTLINQATVLGTGGFPYHITQSGSYRLSGNLVAPGQALFITAAYVTVDMNGFTISCSANCGTTGVGSNGSGTTIENGTVTGYSPAGGSGITLSASGGKVDHVYLNVNNVGVNAGGDTTVTNCTITNGTFGVYGPSVTLTVLNSAITGHVQDAIDIFNGLVSGNTLSNNGSGGINSRGGVILWGGTVNITNNVISNNAVFGIGLGNLSLTGVAGYGSNTFGGNVVDATLSSTIVSMHNNACGGGSC